MRQAIKSLINTTLGAVGLRVISSEWGPRGFLSSFKRLATHGIHPRLIADIGAARGEWTLECMQVFPEAQYFLVDPLEENQPALRALTQRHPAITTWFGALGATEGTLPMHVHGDQSSFLPSEYSKSPALRDVPLRTLDSCIGREIPAPPDLLKIDAQGYELEILQGASQCLKSTEVFLLEVSFRRVYAGAPLAHDVVAFMRDHGFRIYDFCTYVQRPRDRELAHADILFVRDGSRAFAYEGYA